MVGTIVVLKDHFLPDPNSPTEAEYPGLRQLMREMGFQTESPLTHRRVLGTRDLARDLVHRHLVDDAHGVVLDCTGLEVVSSPFLSELLICWNVTGIQNANQDITETWEQIYDNQPSG